MQKTWLLFPAASAQFHAFGLRPHTPSGRWALSPLQDGTPPPWTAPHLRCSPDGPVLIACRPLLCGSFLAWTSGISHTTPGQGRRRAITCRTGLGTVTNGSSQSGVCKWGACGLSHQKAGLEQIVCK